MSATLATAPPTTKYSPDDLLRLPDRGKGFELVGGELKELSVSYQSSYTAGRLFLRLAQFVEARNLGWVAPEGTSFRCFSDDPGRVRRADTAFHLLDRLTPTQATAEGHLTVVPDLVVEVVSPNDLADDVTEKRVEWQTAGAALVWVVFPVQQEVHAFRADGSVTLFRRADTLTADPVLPEFRVPVADLFRLPAANPV
jgi:Uma2 family endonuclease